ncbi:MAG: hypothetical protein V1709_08085 [Planctomycetota bacterium]
MKCREELCNGNVPQGKGLKSLAAKALGLCRYCYNMNYHTPKRGKVKQELNSAQIRERHLRIHREPAKRFYEPKFYKEWLDYWKTYWRNYTE